MIARPRVLIIEDETRLRELLVDVLPDMGYEPIAARTAEAGLKAFAEQPADIVMLDLNLPVMGGMSFLDRFRESHAETPVIIMTGFGDLESAQRAIRHRVVDFLSKPCHLGQIEAALGRARQQLKDPRLHPPADEVKEATTDADPPPADQTLADAERRMIYEALSRHEGNRSAAAAALGISRRTLYNKLAEYEKSDTGE